MNPDKQAPESPVAFTTYNEGFLISTSKMNAGTIKHSTDYIACIELNNNGLHFYNSGLVPNTYVNLKQVDKNLANRAEHSFVANSNPKVKIAPNNENYMSISTIADKNEILDLLHNYIGLHSQVIDKYVDTIFTNIGAVNNNNNANLIGQFGAIAKSSAVNNSKESNIPTAFLCSITLEPMKNPVMTLAGISYEKDAIEDWLKKKDTDPFTNQRLEDKRLIPNINLRNAIAEWKLENNFVEVDQPQAKTEYKF